MGLPIRKEAVHIVNGAEWGHNACCPSDPKFSSEDHLYHEIRQVIYRTHSILEERRILGGPETPDVNMDGVEGRTCGVGFSGTERSVGHSREVGSLPGPPSPMES